MEYITNQNVKGVFEPQNLLLGENFSIHADPVTHRGGGSLQAAHTRQRNAPSGNIPKGVTQFPVAARGISEQDVLHVIPAKSGTVAYQSIRSLK